MLEIGPYLKYRLAVTRSNFHTCRPAHEYWQVYYLQFVTPLEHLRRSFATNLLWLHRLIPLQLHGTSLTNLVFVSP